MSGAQVIDDIGAIMLGVLSLGAAIAVLVDAWDTRRTRRLYWETHVPHHGDYGL